jgi:hypothetical protein
MFWYIWHARETMIAFRLGSISQENPGPKDLVTSPMWRQGRTTRSHVLEGIT